MQTIQALRRSLNAGDLDARLSELYTQGGVEHQRKRYAALLAAFQHAFDLADSAEAALFSAPGRTEIAGNHTDHQRGRVLAAAVSLDMAAAVRSRSDGVIRIQSEGYAPMQLSLTQLRPLPAEQNSSEALVRGIAAYLMQHGFVIGGFDALVRSDVPKGSGLSSSAAYGILIGTILSGLYAGGSVPPLTLALAAKYAENAYFGKPSGLMDQLACASGGFLGIDFFDADKPACTQVACDPASLGYAVCIVNAGGSHADLTGAYAQIPADMREIAACFGKEVLSEVEPTAFYDALGTLRGRASDRAILRAMHFFSENARVPEALAALQNGDMPRFLASIRASGTSSFQCLQNVCPPDPCERSLALALAVSERFLGGRGASRVHGGGFAGTVQAWVPLALLDGYRMEMERVFGEGACYRLQIRPAGGVRL